LRPALASLGGRLVCVSSPYSRSGPMWETFSRSFGQDDPRVLVVRGTTEMLNPTIDRTIILRALEDDEPSARAEWLAEFRTDVQSFISREAVAAVVVPGRFELPPVPGTTYTAFVDPSGGSRDSMTLAIAHAANDRAVLDVVREVVPPFSPEKVVMEFAATLHAYRCSTVAGDRYGGEWAREPFRKAGIEYAIAEQDRSALYLALLPAINSGRVELLDLKRLSAQLLALERRTGRGGRDAVDHPAHGRDDVANAAAGALVAVAAGVNLGPVDRWIWQANAAAPSAMAASASAFYGASGGNSLERDAFGTRASGVHELGRRAFGR